MLTFEKTVQPPRGTKWVLIWKSKDKRDRTQFAFVAVDDVLYFREGWRKPYLFVKITGWREETWWYVALELGNAIYRQYTFSLLFDALEEVWGHYGLETNVWTVPILKPLIS